ncbi:MAG: hypothetical protein NT076_01765 [Candidatus Pacearchaeota archaeon]|nr:hypothetical protein [Candidatus Pacearchaeota archaeon]
MSLLNRIGKGTSCAVLGLASVLGVIGCTTAGREFAKEIVVQGMYSAVDEGVRNAISPPQPENTTVIVQQPISQAPQQPQQGILDGLDSICFTQDGKEFYHFGIITKYGPEGVSIVEIGNGQTYVILHSQIKRIIDK